MKNALLLTIFYLCFLNVYSQDVVLDTLQKKKQQANLAYTTLFKENSALSYTSPGGEIGAPSKYVINGKLTTTYMVFAPISLPIAFAINPDFTVRVRKERSAGVRTPSFRLGGTFYVRLAEELQHYKYAQISFTHHSNGQDESALLSDGTINTKTGNFNTNDLTLSYNFGNYGNANSFHHKVGLEWHKWFNYEPVLIGDYGFTRLNYDFSFRIYQKYSNKTGGWKRSKAEERIQTLEKEKWRFNAQLSYAVNQYANQDLFAPKRRLNVEATANYSLPFMQNVFIMASVGYYGEDPYNIYFKDRYAFMRFGLSSTFTRYNVR